MAMVDGCRSLFTCQWPMADGYRPVTLVKFPNFKIYNNEHMCMTEIRRPLTN